MRDFNFLKKLLDVEPVKRGFVSIYLNTRPNENGQKNFQTFLKKGFSDHLAVMEPNSPERGFLENDQQRVNEYLETLEPSAEGVAIFACAETGFFKSFSFAVPFENNEFFFSDKPRVYPLARLVDDNPRFAVALADTNSARILVCNRGETIRTNEIENTKTNRTEVGGWSQMRFQRHIENFHQQHAKEVAEEISKLVRNDRIQRIILAGDETVIIPTLKAELPEDVSSQVIATLPLNVNTPEHEMMETALKAVYEYDANVDREKVEYLTEHNYENGVGVTGVEETLRALLNGQVQVLFIAAGDQGVNYSAGDVGQILREYSAGMEGEVPELNGADDIIDELIRLAATSVDEIRFVADPHLLKSSGGVGAILRYQVQEASTA